MEDDTDCSYWLYLQITNLDYDEHKGRIAIGRVHAGRMKKGMEVKVCAFYFTFLHIFEQLDIQLINYTYRAISVGFLISMFTLLQNENLFVHLKHNIIKHRAFVHVGPEKIIMGCYNVVQSQT